MSVLGPYMLRPEWANASDEYMARVNQAFLLARDLDSCKALLRGEKVPAERLDPEGMRRLHRIRR